ncbi:MAG: efflux RND transporter periplasmic adaptor subunit [Pirellula sp.]
MSSAVVETSKSISIRVLWSLLRLGMGIALIGAVGFGLFELYRRIQPAADSESEVMQHEVKRRRLEDTVVERGTIESQNTVYGKCELPGNDSSIVFIVPEGTLVAKGDVIVKLESSKIDQQIALKKIALNEAEGKLKEARQNLIAKTNEADGKIVTAEREWQIAKIDVVKYKEGDSKAEESELQRLIADGKAQLQKFLEERKNIELLVKKGYRSPEQLDEYQLRVNSYTKAVLRDEQKLENLKKYDYILKMTTFQGKETDAAKKIEREKSIAAAEIEKAESTIASAKNLVELHQSELDDLVKTLAKCEMKAPQDGTVAYANQPWFDASQRIRTGSKVYQQRDIFFLPDMLNMQVKLGVHESIINRIKKDQTVTIRLDAFPDVKLNGRISYVAELAASSFDDAKNYDATVLINEIPEGISLKPGMTAEVEILIGIYDDILAIPVGAVTEHFQLSYVYLAKGNEFTRKVVKTGRTTHSFVEIVEGLEPGDLVAMDAYRRGTNDFASAERKAGANQSAEKESTSAQGAKE